MSQETFVLIRSRRKTVSIEINRNAEVIVRADPRVQIDQIEKFLLEKQRWIRKKKEYVLDRKDKIIRVNPHLVDQYKIQAYEKIGQRLNWYSTVTGLKYRSFKISGAKSRFGSCTSKGVLSFSWRLIFFPQEIMDYVVVHELTHLKEFNHSKGFWERVGLVLPDYKRHRKWLKENGIISA